MDKLNAHLQVKQLTCNRGEQFLFSDISFELYEGEILLVEGANGSGKSSLLRILTGLSTPTAGEILWRGNIIQNHRDEYANELHYLAHANGVKTGLSVEENLRLSLHLRRCEGSVQRDALSSRAAPGAGSSVFKQALLKTLDPAPGAARDDRPAEHKQPRNDDSPYNDAPSSSNRIENILASLQLTTHKYTHTRHLSAGQKRRVALAKLFLLSKKLWILDEPLTALDTATQTFFLSALEKHLQQGGIAIISSHHTMSVPHAKRLRLASC